MSKRKLLEERPTSVASVYVDRSKKRMKCESDSPSLRNGNIRNHISWSVVKAPPLPYLYIPQRTSAVIKNKRIEDVAARIEYCANQLNIVGEYDALNAKATFTVDTTTFTIQIFSTFENNCKICFIVELLRINGPAAVFHNVAICILNAIRKNDSPWYSNASETKDFDGLQKIIDRLQL